ncbi:hypothetical protein [Haliea sp. E17]|uniref:hypothetical protein n=1 Tax=Haliea sp. E17 TaxID=3401576 RepID=UPI003AAB6D07
MKKLILHLGRAKTGSSTLQEAFGAASESLRDQGVMYPSFKPYNHSFQFTVLFKEDPRATFYYRQFAPADEAEWDAEKARLTRRWSRFFDSANSGVWIISAENLPAMSVAEIQAVVDFVRPYFDEVVAIAYVRHPETVLRSQWEEFVKVMEADVSGQELLEQTVRSYNFRFLNRWSEVLGKDRIVVRPFDTERFLGGTLQSDFLHFAGLQHIDLPLVDTPANVSLGREGAAFLQAYNARYPLYIDGKANPRRGLVGHLHELYSAMREVPTQPLKFAVRFSREEAEHINSQIELVNSYLRPEDRFHPVVASEQPTRVPLPSDIPLDYFVDLVNQLALRIERLIEKER